LRLRIPLSGTIRCRNSKSSFWWKKKGSADLSTAVYSASSRSAHRIHL
jgi:hypothetical protein